MQNNFITKWSKFKGKKKSYYSLILFIIIFSFSLTIELFSNDKPLLVKYKEEYYFPIFKQYSEITFGGDFETEADYADLYVLNLIKKNGFVIFPLLRYSFDTINYNLTSPPPTPPSRDNILGTDDQGRDVFSRLIYGVRVSLVFGILLTIISSVIGIILGAMQGYLGGKFDLIMQRVIEIWSGLPIIFILIILATFVIPSFWWLLLIMVLFSWMSLVSPIRAEFLKARKLDYVLSAKATGVSEFNIILKHILPNSMISALTFIPFILSGSIVVLTSLDFLGFGLPIGTASLGELLAQGKNNPNSSWIGLTTFFMLSFILTLLIFIGEGIRDAFSPENIHT